MAYHMVFVLLLIAGLVFCGFDKLLVLGATAFVVATIVPARSSASGTGRGWSAKLGKRRTVCQSAQVRTTVRPRIVRRLGSGNSPRTSLRRLTQDPFDLHL
jgi:hypothetical protein